MVEIVSIIISLLLLSEPQYTPLELEIKADLDAHITDADFTLTVVAENGQVFTHSVGDAGLTKPYESASTSKWVTSSVLMWLVQNQTLSLDDNPQDYIPAWPTTGNLSDITLKHLLSFTSGLSLTPACVNLPNANFDSCVAKIAMNNMAASVPGEEFYYGPAHMQVAGLMAIKALNVTSWEQVFEQFKAELNLFSNSTYSLPSTTNPRLAGGMIWTANDYREFLSALKTLKIVNQSNLNIMFNNQISTAEIVNSPGLDTWRYGLGLWLECTVLEPNCITSNRVSSPGAYGAYPFIDYQHNYFGLVARQGEISTFENGYAVYESVAEKLAVWATENQN